MPAEDGGDGATVLIGGRRQRRRGASVAEPDEGTRSLEGGQPVAVAMQGGEVRDLALEIGAGRGIPFCSRLVKGDKQAGNEIGHSRDKPIRPLHQTCGSQGFIPLENSECEPPLFDGEEPLKGLEVAGRVLDSQHTLVLAEPRNARGRKGVVGALGNIIEQRRARDGLQDGFDVTLLDSRIHGVVVWRSDH